LKPLQIETLREKVGDMAYYVPPPKIVEGTRPPCPPPHCAHEYKGCISNAKSTSVPKL